MKKSPPPGKESAISRVKNNNSATILLLAGAAALQAEKVSEAHGNSKTEAFSKIRELPRAFRSLIANPTFFFLNLAGASEGLLIAGFAAFLPKLIENQFSVNASWAALLMGKLLCITFLFY